MPSLSSNLLTDSLIHLRQWTQSLSAVGVKEQYEVSQVLYQRSIFLTLYSVFLFVKSDNLIAFLISIFKRKQRSKRGQFSKHRVSSLLRRNKKTNIYDTPF